ncbi:protein Niban 1 isoform X2 [Lepus europaeus]|uniref:protein Niban 1 isoform X2 n=1 Tax=Lepus europaeus TaxID=9983 RepID=UPI002B4742ED|nr:protein Niban 1 isoform X2 [Lepus europaeus]
MGGAASSQLDEARSAYIRGKTEAVLKNFSPYYRRQHAVAFCGHVRRQVEQQREAASQLLKAKPPLEPGTVLYEAELTQFAEDVKKWKDRYIVVKNDFAVESYESREAYQKGAAPRSRVLPVGGKVFTSQAEYSLLADKHFPDPAASGEKETPQPLVVLPKELPVVLWQPYLRHGFFCFAEAAAQKRFSAILSDCIRRLNHDFTKQTTFEAQAFLEAVQFFHQEKGHYGSREMITGDEVQALSSLVMEELLPALQADLLPTMKGKRSDRKRAWFALLEEAFHLVQRQVAEGLRGLKEECQALTEGLEGRVRADMDQIANSEDFLTRKIEAMVAQPAEQSCAESVRPFLASVLEELLGPVSSGFGAVRSLFEEEVDALGRSFQNTKDGDQLKEHLDGLLRLPLDPVKMEACYREAAPLQEQLQDLNSRFRFPHVDLVVQRAQNDMQELMGNAVFTFTQLLSPHLQGEPARAAAAIEKVKLRVLKQYDHDSSAIRRKIFQEALVQITLPTVQRALAPTCKPELQKYEQLIFADHAHMIHVENVYEDILHQLVLREALKVIQEAAVQKKHNLFDDSVALPSESVSSLTDLKTPTGSKPDSPARRASAASLGAPGSEGPGPGASGQAEGQAQPGGNGQGAPVGPGHDTVAPAEGAAELGTAGHPGGPEPASGSLRELRELLAESTPVVYQDAEGETPGAPESEEEEEENAPGRTARSEATAPDVDQGAHSEAGGVEVPTACGADPQPGPEGPAQDPSDKDLQARASVQDTQEGGEAAGVVPSEDWLPRESQGAQAAGSVGTEEAQAPGAHTAQWEVEAAPDPKDTERGDSQGTPEQPSE